MLAKSAGRHSLRWPGAAVICSVVISVTLAPVSISFVSATSFPGLTEMPTASMGTLNLSAR